MGDGEITLINRRKDGELEQVLGFLSRRVGLACTKRRFSLARTSGSWFEERSIIPGQVV